MIIDLLAIAPFYIGETLGGSAIFIRIIRISKVFRIAKLARYTDSLTSIKNAFRNSKEQLIIIFAFFVIYVTICGILLYIFEHNEQPEIFTSIPRSCYFSILAFTTQGGFGEFSPVSDVGRVIVASTSVFVAGIHGILVGVIGSSLMSIQRKKNSAN